MWVLTPQVCSGPESLHSHKPPGSAEAAGLVTTCWIERLEKDSFTLWVTWGKQPNLKPCGCFLQNTFEDRSNLHRKIQNPCMEADLLQQKVSFPNWLNTCSSSEHGFIFIRYWLVSGSYRLLCLVVTGNKAGQLQESKEGWEKQKRDTHKFLAEKSNNKLSGPQAG